MARRSPQIDEAHTKALAGSFTIPAGPPVDQDHGKRAEEWQARAWQVWHRLGEVRFPTAFIARQTTRLTWQVQIGTKEPLDEAQSKAYIDQATRGIGEDEASRLMALNLQVAGEGYYVEDDKGFHVYAVTQDGLKKKIDKAKAAKLPNFRFYYADPTDSEKAESAFMTALDPGEELLVLTALSRAQSRSRLAQAGILMTPQEQSFASGDPFGEDLEKAMAAAIKDERSASAFAPIHVQMSAELIEKVKWLIPERPYDDKIPTKIDTAQRRIAMALDLNQEILLGMADVNHWTGWLISDETYNAHMMPIAARIAEVFASVIELQNPGLGDVTVIPDPSALLARKSTVRDALDAYQAKPPAVSAAYVRGALGADDDDAPSDEELAAAAPAAQAPATVEENPGPPVAASLAPMVEADRFSEGMIAGAVAMAVDTARAKVGAKIRTKLRSHPDAARLEKVPNALCASVCHDHIGDIDLDATILDALAPFMQWWDGQGFSVSPREARLAVATHVKDTIGSAKAEPDRALLTELGAI